MLVFGVQITGFLSRRCVYFPGFYLAVGSTLSLSFFGMVSLPRCGCLYRLEVFRNGLALCPVQRSFWFTSVSQWGVFCIE